MIQEKIDISNKHTKYQFTASVGLAYSEMGLLGQYENAINIIIKDLKATNTRIDVVAHPVLYMMRHSLELGYKRNFEYLANYSNRKTSRNLFGCHDLQKLHAEIRVHFDVINHILKFDKALIDEFRKYFDDTTILINQLGATEASTFRYTKDIKGKKIFESSDIIDVGEIKGLYDNAIAMLTHTADLIAPYTDYVDLIDKNPNFQEGTGIVLMKFPSFQLDFISEKLDEKHNIIGRLEWKDKSNGQPLRIIEIENDCYLTPIK